MWKNKFVRIDGKILKNKANEGLIRYLKPWFSSISAHKNHMDAV